MAETKETKRTDDARETKEQTRADEAAARDAARGYRVEERGGAPYYVATDGRYESANEGYVRDYVREARALAAEREAAGLTE